MSVTWHIFPGTMMLILRYHLIPCGICGGHSGAETRLSPTTSIYSASSIPLMLHTHSFTYLKIWCR